MQSWGVASPSNPASRTAMTRPDLQVVAALECKALEDKLAKARSALAEAAQMRTAAMTAKEQMAAYAAIQQSQEAALQVELEAAHERIQHEKIPLAEERRRAEQAAREVQAQHAQKMSEAAQRMELQHKATTLANWQKEKVTEFGLSRRRGPWQ